MLVYEAIGETLSRLGVEAVFGLIGDGNLRIVKYMAKDCDIAYYGSNHEEAAVGMADGYARVSGRLGVCSVTKGPGLTNVLTSLAEATKSRTPLLLVTGDTAINKPNQNQSVDQAAVVRSVGVGVEQARGSETVVEDLVRAVRRAETERRPILFPVPMDLQEKVYGREAPQPVVGPVPVVGPPSDDDVSRLADLLERARRPLIIAGRGAVRAKAGQQLETLGEQIGALLATSAMAKGLFAGNPFSLDIAGGFSSSLAERLMREADVVVSFGASLNSWTTRNGTLFSPSAEIVQCDIEPEAIGAFHPVTLGVVGDAGLVASALIDELDRQGFRSEGFRTDSVRKEIADFRWEDEFEDQSTEDTIDPRTLMLALNQLLPRERTVTLDGGHFVSFASKYLSAPDAAGFVFGLGFQSVGLGLGMGMGAAVARPDRLTVTVVGDGGLRMSLGELDAVLRHRLPILVVVVNDAAYGAEIHHFNNLGMPPDLAFLEDRDFAAIGRAMGAEGSTVRNLADLERVEQWIRALELPMILDCKVNRQLHG
jgi:thiamine pyrophosphate-dependent acetolactate synthase large subunit-like protein